MTQYFEDFKTKLQEMFMTDTDLDFGIYRIMKAKHKEIEKFIDTDLKKTVDDALSQGGKGDKQDIKKQMKEIELRMGNVDLHTLPEAIPDVKKYLELEKQLGNSVDIADLEDDVYSRLTDFFSRYYDNGDFVSNRRYTSIDSSYVIPYDGEEVKLHWANNDQYYIKTSENFQNYKFNAGGYAIRFELVNATSEQNNNKSTEDKKRTFMLYSEVKKNEEGLNKNTPDVETFEIAEVTDAQEGMPAKEFIVRFVYDIPSVKKETVIDPKTGKEKEQDIDWTERAYAAIMTYLNDNDKELIYELIATYKTSKKDVLRHHLDSYVGKNSFDYFIHKDLGRFLRFELDYYIKNEVLLLQDLDIDTVSTHLNVAKAIKTIGEKVITFLAQIEDFQKKLWLKKKFVLQSNYCITLDRVPTSFYAEIADNEQQRKEWVRLFAIDKIQGDLMYDGYSEPLTVPFLEQNPYLVLDTAFFSLSFKHRLETVMKDVDENINGLLINSENFQALELLQEKYAESVKCVYIDPPYNIDGDGFVYKDNFRESTWLSMMSDRLNKGKSLMSQDAPIFISIDDTEQSNVKSLCDLNYGDVNFYAQIIWQKRTSPDARYNLGAAHDFITVYAKEKELFKGSINKLQLSEERASQYKNPDNDPRGDWASVDITGQTGHATDGQFYKITTPGGKEMYPPKGRCWALSESTFKYLVADNRIWFGEDGNARPRQKKFLTESEGANLWTWWPNSEVGHNQEATKELAALFGNGDVFTNPKPVRLIKRISTLASKDNGLILDYFAGSGTTGAAIISLNREFKESKRKFILCEMGLYFNTVTKPRIQKVIYSDDWRSGNPVSRKGISQCFKYLRLEQYEDTLNNLSLVQPTSAGLFNDEDFSNFREGYLLHYMLDTETRGSLFNLEWFTNPFNMRLMASEDNELVETQVDLVETFNYLIGLEVESIRWNEEESICAVVGKKHIGGDKVLVLWRNCTLVDNDQLNAYFCDNCKDIEGLDTIYANGNSLLGTMKAKSDHWTVELTEAEFMNKMFNLEEAE